MRFSAGYANDHNRPAIITQPILHRELMGTVRREALLAMATHVDELAPQFLGPGRERHWRSFRREVPRRQRDEGARQIVESKRRAEPARNAPRFRSAAPRSRGRARPKPPRSISFARNFLRRWGKRCVGRRRTSRNLRATTISTKQPGAHADESRRAEPGQPRPALSWIAAAC